MTLLLFDAVSQSSARIPNTSEVTACAPFSNQFGSFFPKVNGGCDSNYGAHGSSLRQGFVMRNQGVLIL